MSFVNMKMLFITAFIRPVIWFCKNAIKLWKQTSSAFPKANIPCFNSGPAILPKQYSHQDRWRMQPRWWILSPSKWQEMCTFFQDSGFKNEFQDSSVQLVCCITAVMPRVYDAAMERCYLIRQPIVLISHVSLLSEDGTNSWLMARPEPSAGVTGWGRGELLSSGPPRFVFFDYFRVILAH